MTVKVAGLKVNDGYIKKSMKYRLLRDGNVIEDDLEVVSLRKFKKEVKEIRGGDEGGISFKKVDEIVKGDVLECYM